MNGNCFIQNMHRIFIWLSIFYYLLSMFISKCVLYIYIYVHIHVSYNVDVGWGIPLSVYDHLLCSKPTYCVFYLCFVKLYILNMGNSIRHINYVLFFFSSFLFLLKFIIFGGSELIYSFNIIPVVSRY